MAIKSSIHKVNSSKNSRQLILAELLKRLINYLQKRIIILKSDLIKRLETKKSMDLIVKLQK